MERENNGDYFLFGRLLHQYITDMYVKIEQERLNYIKRNQAAIRYYVEDVEDMNDERAVLPSSFIGGPRFMKENYHDAMTIARNLGKGDLFITITANTHWREIRENMPAFLDESSRPDLIVRVFKLKLKSILEEITQGNLFGPTAGLIYVIEYQKRGLPHAHIVVFLKEGYKLTTTSQIDNVICAEIPPDYQNDLLSKVKKYMMHTSCMNNNRAVCLDDNGQCKRKFPKSLQLQTTLSDNGYPTYRRRFTNTIQLSDGRSLNDGQVVPYNAYLLRRYDCHINVEYCGGFKSIKYLFKYVYKGPDTINASFSNDEFNEVNEYVTGTIT